MPRDAQHRSREQPDRAAAGHQHAIVRRRFREVHRVNRDGGRLGQCGRARRERLGDAEQARRGHDLVTAERAVRPREQVADFASEAHRGTAAPARPALAAAGRGVLHDARRRSPNRRRRIRARRSFPPIRGRARCRGGRSGRARGAGRCRRSRSARPPRARRSGRVPERRAPALPSRRRRDIRRPASVQQPFTDRKGRVGSLSDARRRQRVRKQRSRRREPAASTSYECDVR